MLADWGRKGRRGRGGRGEREGRGRERGRGGQGRERREREREREREGEREEGEGERGRERGEGERGRERGEGERGREREGSLNTGSWHDDNMYDTHRWRTDVPRRTACRLGRGRAGRKGGLGLPEFPNIPCTASTPVDPLGRMEILADGGHEEVECVLPPLQSRADSRVKASVKWLTAASSTKPREQRAAA
jgi:hypothetical protein